MYTVENEREGKRIGYSLCVFRITAAVSKVDSAFTLREHVYVPAREYEVRERIPYTWSTSRYRSLYSHYKSPTVRGSNQQKHVAR